MKVFDFKSNLNPSSESGAGTCGRTDRRTDMTKAIVASRDYANAPKINLKVTSTEFFGTNCIASVSE